MNILKFTIFTIVVFLLLYSCKKDDEKVPSNTGIVYKDITYKTIDGQNLKLDILMPTALEKDLNPTVIFIHGGVWVGGDKSLIDSEYRSDLANAIRNEGYTLVCLDFRQLTGSATFPINIADCKDAVRWLKKNAAEYKIDTTNIGLWGTSSGGHVALMTAITDDSYSGLNTVSGSYTTKVNYIIDHFGPTDLKAFFTLNSQSDLNLLQVTNYNAYTDEVQKILELFGVNPQSEFFSAQEMSIENSPVKYIHTGMPPVLVMHGTSDLTVPISQSQILVDSLSKYQVEHEFYKYENAGHVFYGASPEQMTEATSKVIAFMKKYTK